jgi:ketopantoate reductase
VLGRGRVLAGLSFQSGDLQGPGRVRHTNNGPTYLGSHKFHRPSMTQHLGRGQQTEIDALNGYVARESARLGLAAPYNDALAKLMKGRQHRPACGAL